MRLLLAAPVGRPSRGDLGASVLELEQSLRALGHDVDTFRFPTIRSPAAAMEYGLAMGLLDLGAEAHRVITVGWQCHLLRHPAKIALVLRGDAASSLLSPETEHAHLPYLRAALSSALQNARRIVVADPAMSGVIRALTGTEPQVRGECLTRREAVGTWLD